MADKRPWHPAFWILAFARMTVMSHARECQIVIPAEAGIQVLNALFIRS
jgi:hypothetical protein